MDTRELDAVTFYRRSVLIRPKPEDLLTLADADEHKLSALDQLLKKIIELYLELDSVKLALKDDKHGQNPRVRVYELVDMEYIKLGKFKIRIKSNWLNPADRRSLHEDFNFQLFVKQESNSRCQIADWIDIRICRLNTTPMELASMCEHVKNLSFLLKNPESYFFYDLPMNCTDKIINGRLNFSTIVFKEAVKNACKIMEKLISRKKHLRIYKRKP